MKVIHPYVGITHYQDPEHDGELTSETLCGRDVEICRVADSGDAECSDCSDAAGG